MDTWQSCSQQESLNELGFFCSWSPANSPPTAGGACAQNGGPPHGPSAPRESPNVASSTPQATEAPTQPGTVAEESDDDIADGETMRDESTERVNAKVTKTIANVLTERMGPGIIGAG